MDVREIAADTEIVVADAKGREFRLLRLSAQVAAEAAGSDMLAFAEAQRMSKDGTVEVDQLTAQISLNKLKRAYLSAAMVSPRLAADDLHAGGDGDDSIGYKRLGDFATALFDALMASSGDPSVFRLSPQVGEGQS
jgi:hypothetical protein